MVNQTNLDDTILKRRKAMVTGMIALTLVVILGFAFVSLNFLRRMGDYLEDELGARLHAVATLTARNIEATDFLVFDLQSPRVQKRLEEILTTIHFENQLQGVYLVDAQNRVIASSRGLFQAGDQLPFLAEDSLAIADALAGVPAVAGMQVIAGNRFKSAYAPVFADELEGLVVVQASADFFDLIGVFQQGLIYLGIASVTISLLFCILLYGAIRLLIKTHESLRQSERLAAMGQMAATVAHEIRNPLSIIKGTAEVLQSKYRKEDEPDELFDFIPDEVRRLNRLVSDFLTFARDRAPEYNATDLKSTVEKTLVNLDDEIKKSAVSLRVNFTEVPAVDHDEDGINQVLLNLILNALQAMPDGGDLTLTMENERAGLGKRFVSVCVHDTGCGFDQGAEDVFEPFYTTKTSGSGLGLAICKRIVEKHEGWMDVRSEKDKGTKMRFYLPARSN